MIYINRLNINFDQWDKLNNSGWYNMEFVENKKYNYYIIRYPVGTKVKIRKDSKYYNRNTKNNPKDTIGYINFYYDKYHIVKKDDLVVHVNWNTGGHNTYKIIDLEYYKK
jgi:hypothetical protein